MERCVHAGEHERHAPGKSTQASTHACAACTRVEHARKREANQAKIRHARVHAGEACTEAHADARTERAPKPTLAETRARSPRRSSRPCRAALRPSRALQLSLVPARGDRNPRRSPRWGRERRHVTRGWRPRDQAGVQLGARRRSRRRRRGVVAHLPLGDGARRVLRATCANASSQRCTRRSGGSAAPWNARCSHPRLEGAPDSWLPPRPRAGLILRLDGLMSHAVVVGGASAARATSGVSRRSTTPAAGSACAIWC